ncbi:uncharacterized protein F5Z01DRAFT_733367 [Emericellopsis atlantica]|uniref:Core Histone H2A/H2B/H3 domain-containing protein n=1 Tax=Emericellopsis atlantica TaxID=2614577 RepID=A0A9P8CSY0_9HYPO|nr:uncharacterized protein F5Z01DRAFT_733367 [Emericellopsis atlantica]KAG9257832.1 hypothetical protein F5Z01DRAFT_733367 [Emericellopsis atlantica]
MVELRPPFVTTRLRSRPATRRVIKKKPALLINKEPFARLVQEITQDIAAEVSFQRSALLTLQEIVELNLVQMFTLASHRNAK